MEGMDSVTSGRDNNQVGPAQVAYTPTAAEQAMHSGFQLAVQESQQEPQQAPLASPIMIMGEITEAEGGQGLVQSDTDARLGRLIDHVNREIGVAQDTPLHMRLDKLEKLLARTIEKINDKTTLLK